ncbi:YdeI/OmpD-associated family protein (plasmid) [Roseobacteraceae bacterium NS-SX3]
MISEIEDYFTRGCGRCERFGSPQCATAVWAVGLSSLRRICLESGLHETVKWGHPCYMHASRNIALIGAFQGDFRLSFFNAALMKDPHGILEKRGPNTKHPDMIRFVGNGQPTAREAEVRAYLHEAMEYAEDGIRPPKDDSAPDLPAELAEALNTDPVLAEAFSKLTPGRQKSYVINLNGAKRAATRVARITKFRGRILKGKGAMER